MIKIILNNKIFSARTKEGKAMQRPTKYGMGEIGWMHGNPHLQQTKPRSDSELCERAQNGLQMQSKNINKNLK